MTRDPDKPQPQPLQAELEQSAANLVRIWQHMANGAAHIAAAKRSLYLAYLAEGFTEAQALELAKTL